MRMPIRFFAALCFGLLFTFLPNGVGKMENAVADVDEGGRAETLRNGSPDRGERSLTLSAREIYHYEPLSVTLSSPRGHDASGLSVVVSRDGKARKSGDGRVRIPFLPDPDAGGGAYRAVYLPDFNARAGTYEIAVFDAGGNPLPLRASFAIKKKPLPPMKKGLVVADLEMNESLRRKSFVSPDGARKDFSAILEWVDYMHADALWILAGETTGFEPKSPYDDPWDRGPLENLALLKELAPRFGVEIGAYIMCFYVPGRFGVPQRYEAATGYDSRSDTLYGAKHISLASERRIQDIIELARRFQADPQIHYIGFDFIRTGKADGYELVEEFVRETNARVPDGWGALPKSEKIRRFARKIEVERDPLMIEQWRWWRARTVALIIKRVIEEAGITKPVWVYTLGWNHGKEHGQDPVMFFDAGVAIDAVMLYEANGEQFKNLLPQWRSYMGAGDGNIIIGNCVDEKLLDSDTLSPPDELYRRNVEGYRSIIQGGLAKGMFFHDLSRAFWGRKGAFSTKDYATAFQSSAYSLRKELQVAGLVVDLVVRGRETGETDGTSIRGFIEVKNHSEKSIDKVVIELVDPQTPGGLNYVYNNIRYENGSRFDMGRLGSRESKKVEFAVINRDGLPPTSCRIRFKVEISDRRVYYITELVRPA